MTPHPRSTTTGDGLVTWGMLDRVLDLALTPIKDTLDEVRDDVKLLLDDRSARTGADVERKRWLESRRFVIGLIVTLGCGLVGALATLVWLASTH